VGWLTRWPELRDVVMVSLGALVILVLLGVWAVTGRVPPPAFLAWLGPIVGLLLGLPAALATRRIISTGQSSSSLPSPSSPSPSSPPPPGAANGG
jgi:hypothetical protein